MPLTATRQYNWAWQCHAIKNTCKSASLLYPKWFQTEYTDCHAQKLAEATAIFHMPQMWRNMHMKCTVYIYGLTIRDKDDTCATVRCKLHCTVTWFSPLMSLLYRGHTDRKRNAQIKMCSMEVKSSQTAMPIRYVKYYFVVYKVHLNKHKRPKKNTFAIFFFFLKIYHNFRLWIREHFVDILKSYRPS